MYAVPHAVTITDPSAAAAGLDQVVPQVSGLPGFVAGYWMARSADQGLAVVVFDSEEQAGARERDPQREERLKPARETMADVLDGSPEFVDLSVVEEWTG